MDFSVLLQLMVAAVFTGRAPYVLKESFVKASLGLETIIHGHIIHFPAQSDLPCGPEEPSLSDISHDGHTCNVMEIIVELPCGIMASLA